MSDVELQPQNRSCLGSIARTLAPMQALAATITVTSVMSGVVPLTQTALSSGGPVMMVFGFAFASMMAFTIALSLADIASGFPNVKGGLIEYSRRLAPKKYSRFSAWVVGWLHFFAFVTGATSCAFSFALFATSAIEIATGAVPQRWVTVLIHCVVSLAFGVINALHINVDMASAVWHVLGPIIVLLTIATSSKNPPPPSWVFSHFENQTGWTNSFYVTLLGLIQGAFTMTGYDAPIHTSYGIKNAALKVPQGILYGFMVSFTMGEILILTFLFGIDDIQAIINPAVSGISAVEIFVRLISSCGTTCILVIFIGTFFFCGQGILKACSEIGLELAVSGAFPKSEYLSQVGSQGQPTRIGWLCVGMSCFLGMLYLGNTTLLGAMSSAIAIQLNLVYSIPIALRLFFPNPTRFQPGPFTLGRYSRPLAMVAISWSCLGVFIFSLPGTYPISAENMNYASILLISTLSFILGYWYFSAKEWFGIEKKQSEFHDENQARMEAERGLPMSIVRDGPMQEKDLDEIEDWLDHLERDLRDLK
ncbi:choline transport protein [Entomortierella parvispora]|uniref:Choline transport protein n=1 Tax=Entomortierella parvispora TaxID=205924 RepID=A0A9P3H8S7_9FUNG|nr:choline transport protein [Entomortierella parvispora]